MGHDKNVQTFKTRNLNTLCLLHTLSVTQHNSLQAAAKTHFHKTPCPASCAAAGHTFPTNHHALQPTAKTHLSHNIIPCMQQSVICFLHDTMPCKLQQKHIVGYSNNTFVTQHNFLQAASKTPFSHNTMSCKLQKTMRFAHDNMACKQQKMTILSTKHHALHATAKTLFPCNIIPASRSQQHISPRQLNFLQAPGKNKFSVT